MSKDFRISTFIEKSYKPIIAISVLLIIITFLISLKVFSLNQATFIHVILDSLNLNQQNNLAAWFNVLIWIVCGLSFIMIGFNKSSNEILTKKSRQLLIVVGIFVCLVSFEKVFHIHLLFEFRAINILGFFSPRMHEDSPYYWLFLIIIPVFLIFLVRLVIIYYKLVKGISVNNRLQRQVILFLVSAIVCMPLVVGFDVLQGYFWYSGQKNTVFNSLEAIFELIGLCCLIGGNKFIASHYSA